MALESNKQINTLFKWPIGWQYPWSPTNPKQEKLHLWNNIAIHQTLWHFTSVDQKINHFCWLPMVGDHLFVENVNSQPKAAKTSDYHARSWDSFLKKTWIRYLVVRNSGFSRSRNTWKLTPIFSLINKLIY